MILLECTQSVRQMGLSFCSVMEGVVKKNGSSAMLRESEIVQDKLKRARIKRMKLILHLRNSLRSMASQATTMVSYDVLWYT